MRLLALDTASALCSVAVMQGEEVRWLETPTQRDHATLLLPMIEQLMAEAGLQFASLDAIAFGRGPGSFTGLRVAASVAQGLALGASLPVVPVSDLRALALQAAARASEQGGGPAPLGVACCMDARMSEVYAAWFPLLPGGLPADVPETVCAPRDFRPVGPMDAVIGRGFDAYAEDLGPLIAQAPWRFPAAEPRAREIARLAALDFAAGLARDAAEALPVYLRDNVAKPAP
jgi:tRNA threonylcarbamoyladenosine biosynthesis protein TsaB